MTKSVLESYCDVCLRCHLSSMVRVRGRIGNHCSASEKLSSIRIPPAGVCSSQPRVLFDRPLAQTQSQESHPTLPTKLSAKVPKRIPQGSREKAVLKLSAILEAVVPHGHAYFTSALVVFIFQVGEVAECLLPQQLIISWLKKWTNHALRSPPAQAQAPGYLHTAAHQILLLHWLLECHLSWRNVNFRGTIRLACTEDNNYGW